MTIRGGAVKQGTHRGTQGYKMKVKSGELARLPHVPFVSFPSLFFSSIFFFFFFVTFHCPFRSQLKWILKNGYIALWF